MSIEDLTPEQTDKLLADIIVKFTALSHTMVDNSNAEIKFMAIYYANRFAAIRADCAENHISFLSGNH